MDLGNSLFELFASLFILNHCRVIYKDKDVKGVSALSVAFFFSWGIWNLFYYPHLGQTFSFYAGIGVCLANLIWLYLILYYRVIASECCLDILKRKGLSIKCWGCWTKRSKKVYTHANIQRRGDEFHCIDCGQWWDASDPLPPSCKDFR